MGGRALTVRALVLFSVAVNVVQTVYEGAADLGAFGADYDGIWSVIDGFGTFVALAAAIALAAWAAALIERVGNVRHDAGSTLPNPHLMGWLVFLFPLTVHFPYLYLRRAARAIGARRGERLFAAYYGLLAVVIVVAVASDAIYVLLPGSEGWQVAYTALLWLPDVAAGLLVWAAIPALTRPAQEAHVADVFA